MMPTRKSKLISTRKTRALYCLPGSFLTVGEALLSSREAVSELAQPEEETPAQRRAVNHSQQRQVDKEGRCDGKSARRPPTGAEG